MPRLKVLTASGADGRRFLQDTLREMEEEGYLRAGASGEDEWSSLIPLRGLPGCSAKKELPSWKGPRDWAPFPMHWRPF